MLDDLEWRTHPLSQILRICQLPRKGELLTHPQGLHFIWKLRRYCKKLPLRGELANGGFGLGIDRLTMLLCGLSIKDAEFLFRGPNRLTP